jgi:hypothetical protein
MKKETNPTMIGVAVVIGLVIVALLGYKFLGPKAKPPDTRESNAAYQQYQKTKQAPMPERPTGGSPGSHGSPYSGGSPNSGGSTNQ